MPGCTDDTYSTAWQSWILRVLGKRYVAKPVMYFLGILVDSNSMTLSLPPEKVRKLHSEIDFFKGRKQASKRQLQRLCGILSHCSRVVRGARTFSSRVIEL